MFLLLHHSIPTITAQRLFTQPHHASQPRGIEGGLYNNLAKFKVHDYTYTSSRQAGETRSVGMGDAVASDYQLETGGLSTCAAIGFTYNGKNFLSHVSAKTAIRTIQSEIKENFDIEALRDDPDFEIYLWNGRAELNDIAVNHIGVALKDLGLLEKLAYIGSVAGSDTVGVNENGVFHEGL